ncbi:MULTISPECIES: contact-dependent growth inhibition system immunity protein [unclassified Streptomyces]|uniref:contact-dependent growth inhibition system immunity protein n=1 Tax=unclassified Streptomyces TaxID=2593676 RepID=UPI002E12B358|nr:contact-dependent growth inhibition system immunity protein [Streptomyces sp. NBC_01201]
MINRSLSLEELEHKSWPAPPLDSTGLVRTVHALRKRPIQSLDPYELGRMIGQDVGLPWLLPLAVEILRDTAEEQAEEGFYDDALLTAVLTRSPETWRAMPDIASEVQGILRVLKDVSLYVEDASQKFVDSIRTMHG